MTTLPSAKASRLLLALVGLALGCSSVRTSVDPDFVLRAGESFAWSPSLRPPAGSGADVPWSEYLQAVGSELRALGLREAAAPDAADVLVHADIDIDVVTIHNDAFYNLYVAERSERATFTVELSRRTAPTPSAWRGECQDRLRYVARTMGGVAGPKDWHQVDEPRVWHVQDVVDKLLERLPRPEPE